MTRLELGCGKRPTPGYVHHDKTRHGDWVDVAHDLEQLPWPWADEQFEEIIALDVMEHLRLDVSEWLDEFWRTLKDNGLLILRLPAWDNPLSYRDPTHRRVFHEESFDYWDPDKQLHHDFGSGYFSASDRWWKVEEAKRCIAAEDVVPVRLRPDQPYRFYEVERRSAEDLWYLLRKRASVPKSPPPTPTPSSTAAASSTGQRAAGFQSAQFRGFYREPHGELSPEGIPKGGRGFLIGKKHGR